MAIPTKALAVAAARFQRNTSSAGPSYEEGIRGPRRSQNAAAIAAEPLYEQGVTAAIGRKAFGKGLRAAGEQAWVDGATTKGVPRYPGGVAAAIPKYERRFAPFLSLIAGLTLPARAPAGDPRNIQRVSGVTGPLHDAKVKAG